MWRYILLVCALVVSAEAAGLGGVPAAALTFENAVFALLMLASIALALKGYVRH
jgi:hypothetical protein